MFKLPAWALYLVKELRADELDRGRPRAFVPRCIVPEPMRRIP